MVETKASPCAALEKAIDQANAAAYCHMRRSAVPSKPGATALLFLCAGLAGLSARAGSPGSTGANFLTFGQGPRAIGMGESQVAVAEDAYAAYWNPAGLAAMEYPQIAITYNKALEGVDQQYFSLAYPLRLGSVVNLNLTRLGMSSFQGYDVRGCRPSRSAPTTTPCAWPTATP